VRARISDRYLWTWPAVASIFAPVSVVVENALKHEPHPVYIYTVPLALAEYWLAYFISPYVARHLDRKLTWLSALITCVILVSLTTSLALVHMESRALGQQHDGATFLPLILGGVMAYLYRTAKSGR
jgi:hypothetical protein